VVVRVAPAGYCAVSLIVFLLRIVACPSRRARYQRLPIFDAHPLLVARLCIAEPSGTLPMRERSMPVLKGLDG